MILPPCAPEVLDGRCLIREVRPYQTSRFQSWSGVKVNIGEQREFRLVSCPENCSRCCHLSADVCRAMLVRTSNQSVLVHRTAPVMVLMVLFSCTSTKLVCAEFLHLLYRPYSCMYLGFCSRNNIIRIRNPFRGKFIHADKCP